MILWQQFPRDDAENFKSINLAGFQKPTSGSLWGSNNLTPNDIIQGDVADCYFLSSLAAIAEFPDRAKQIFLN